MTETIPNQSRQAFPNAASNYSLDGEWRQVALLKTIKGVLDWDSDAGILPKRGAEYRATQLELLERQIHQRITDPKFIDAVNEIYDLRESLSEDQSVNITEIKRLVDRSIKLPEKFVAERVRVASLTNNLWQSVKEKGDFKAVLPGLEKLFSLCREEADYIGYDQNPYDVLLDGYEPGARIADILPQLESLGTELAKIVPDLSRRFPAVSCDRGFRYSNEAQFSLSKKVASDMGFDFEAGRIDLAVHPFMTGLGPNDIRITTKFYSDNYLSGLYSTIHEAGHALYAAGLPPDMYGTPRGTEVSLGIHESQSRFWENIVGKSQAFSRYLYGVLKDCMPDEYARTSPEQIWSELNSVTPSLIRIEADEVTYSLHVLIRTILEEQVINDRLKVKDLPEAWNELYKKYLGITPPSNTLGVMQDTHWYCGLIGYFPTYVLGNIYGAAMTESMRVALPDFDGLVERGEFKPVLDWLRENVHSMGMKYRPVELVERITQQPLSSEPFLNYIRSKFGV